MLDACAWPPFLDVTLVIIENPAPSNMPKRISLNECIWVYGETIYTATPNARPEIDALKPRGAKTFMLKIGAGADEVEQLRKLIWQSDAHVILTRLHPKELNLIKPIIEQRKNFSIFCDDSCITPHWFMCEADYVVYRCYNGVTVRLGKPWTVDSPPLFFNPLISPTKYAFTAAALRVPALAISPAVSVLNYFRRKNENTDPSRYLYFPHAVIAEDLPLKSKPDYKYDFANTGSICGIWFMRDPFMPFSQTFTNLYCDRLRLTKMIQSFEGNPFRVYHNQGKYFSWNAYVERSSESKFVINTGGLMDNFGPKFLEYACLGVPMIGRGVPYEGPFLDDCLFPVDTMHVTRKQLKPLLDEALERHAKLRENCLNWRDRLLKLHSPNAILDALQAQYDGKPIPSGYLKVDLKNPSPK
jgi:hypothetical protein